MLTIKLFGVNKMMLPENTFLLQDDCGKKYILSTDLECLNSLIIFMRAVVYGKDTYIKTAMKSNGKHAAKVSTLGHNLSRLGQYASIFTRDYVFHPIVAFFFAEYRAHEIQRCVDCGPNSHAGNGRTVTDVFDDFVTVMRSHSFETGLKKKISDWESKAKKNLKRVHQFEKQLFARYARLTVIRLDLEHLAATFSTKEIEAFLQETCMQKMNDKDWYWDGGDLSTPKKADVRVSFEEVQRDRERLFANMKGKPSLFRHLVGYVWRIECTPKAGYHLHLALFFNGSQVEKHEWLAHQIGEYWAQEITQGRGRFHNCNMAWDSSSPHYGLGEVNHDDHAKRANLRERVLPYLAKAKQAVHALPYKGCNQFGCGFAHRDRSKGRGRTRTKDVRVHEKPKGARVVARIRNRHSLGAIGT
ncbi:inovirus Gp2 family protein [Roseateles oligotrophus]|uniref:Inovirus Gp2 family protein n=1 Tax=Roseateles oligotrophus TaxID=1769250 RepID=A0ABT2YIZ2_9BURK|nr:inovirus Gp2 family protein [Roseateles oligotrophus]MCV2370019.1 inovirus Gp2 family protein [Roseateles oligotrophus]